MHLDRLLAGWCLVDSSGINATHRNFCGLSTMHDHLHLLPQVLLFPGGAREVNKKVGEEYKLFWKDSPGAAASHVHV
jgi:hypothetical protein